jgi:NAD(P)-dependent dehydrogenase (short-subunit alcohol dehydrogenase family)
MQSIFDLTGKVAVVSGAASGLGRAASLALAMHGADLLLADLNVGGMELTAAEIRKLGRVAVTSRTDISDEDDILQLYSTLDHEFGRIDFLANIAGEGILGTPEDMPLTTVQQVFQNLVFGRFVMCQEAGRRMLAARRGSIVNVGSLASVTALGRGHIAYSMAMGAVVQMTRELSTEWASHGVRCNAILPAQVLNPSLEKRMATDPGIGDQWLSGIPSGRLGHPSDIQGLVVLLASDASEWITGTLIPMDGGNLAANAGATLRKRLTDSSEI